MGVCLLLLALSLPQQVAVLPRLTYMPTVAIKKKKIERMLNEG
jgi:hypothetical protein